MSQSGDYVMSLRTYLPGLLALLRATCRYIARNQDRIERFIGPENVAALTAVVVACEALEVILEAVIVPGT